MMLRKNFCLIGTRTKRLSNVPEEGRIAGARKDDGGKPPVYRGVLSYFPRAIASVAAVSHFGANKYAWKGWQHVPDGIDRYSDAMVRHMLLEGTDEVLDDESGLAHSAHVAWNALARLELMLREQDGKDN